MVGELVVWHGDTGQMMALLVAIEHNCTCKTPNVRNMSGTCPAHQSLLNQRQLDGLLFARWLRTRLIVEESRRVR